MRRFALNTCWPALLLVAAGVCLLDFAPAALAGARSEAIPVQVRMVLIRIQPMMQKEQYAAAAEVLSTFMAREKSLDATAKKRKIYTHHMLYYARGNCELMQARYSQAVKSYQQALKQYPDYAAALRNLARANYALKRYGEAGACFVKGYERAEKKRVQDLYFAASCYGQAEKYHDSLTAFELLMKNHPAEVKLAWKDVLVQALLALNENHRALGHIEELALKTGGKGREQWQALLLSQYVELGMNTEAAQYAAELTEEYPLKARWWKALAHFELTRGDYREALVAMTIYGRLGPVSSSEKKLMADLYLQENIPQKAALLYTSLLVDKFDPLLTEKLARCFLWLDQPDNAIEWIDRALAQHRVENLLLLKGDIFYEARRYSEAYVVYAAAAGIQDETAGKAWLMMGYCALNAGNFPDAAKALATARRYPTEKKDATIALNYLENNRAKLK